MKANMRKRKLKWSLVTSRRGTVWIGRDVADWTRAVLIRDPTGQCWEWFRWNDRGGVASTYRKAIDEAEAGI